MGQNRGSTVVSSGWVKEVSNEDLRDSSTRRNQIASELSWQFDNALELVNPLTPGRVAVNAKSIILCSLNCWGAQELDSFFSKVIQGLLLHIVQQLFVCAARIKLKNQL